MYRFKLVERYNKYSIYYDNKKREYFRNTHITNNCGAIALNNGWYITRIDNNLIGLNID